MELTYKLAPITDLIKLLSLTPDHARSVSCLEYQQFMDGLDITPHQGHFVTERIITVLRQSNRMIIICGTSGSDVYAKQIQLLAKIYGTEYVIADTITVTNILENGGNVIVTTTNQELFNCAQLARSVNTIPLITYI